MREKKANRQIMCKHVERRNQSAHRSESREGINENSEVPMIILDKLLIHEDCEDFYKRLEEKYIHIYTGCPRALCANACDKIERRLNRVEKSCIIL